MKRGVVLFAVLGLLLAGSGPAGTVPSAGDDNILEFKSMFGVVPPNTGATNPIRGVAGAGAPWRIDSGTGELKADGKIEVEILGLVLVGTGTNPLPNFRALVSCQSIDGMGNPSIVNLSTGDFPATPSGDAEIEEHLELPDPCIAPIIFVTISSGRWLAVTGR